MGEGLAEKKEKRDFVTEAGLGVGVAAGGEEMVIFRSLPVVDAVVEGEGDVRISSSAGRLTVAGEEAPLNQPVKPRAGSAGVETAGVETAGVETAGVETAPFLSPVKEGMELSSSCCRGICVVGEELLLNVADPEVAASLFAGIVLKGNNAVKARLCVLCCRGVACSSSQFMGMLRGNGRVVVVTGGSGVRTSIWSCTSPKLTKFCGCGCGCRLES